MNERNPSDGTPSKGAKGASKKSEGGQTAEGIILNSTEIIFSAPFRTDILLDSKKLLGKYKEIRENIESKLLRTTQFSGWVSDPHIDKSSKNFGIISPDKPGLTTLPPYFLGYKILAEDISNKKSFEHLQEKIICELNCRINKINSNNNEDKKTHFSDENFQIIKAKLKFFEFGFGSIVIYGRFITKDIDIKSLKFAIESDEIKSILDGFISEYIVAYDDSVSQKIRQCEENSDKKYLMKPKKVYWTHRLVSFVLSFKELNDNDEDNSKINFEEFYNETKGLLTKSITFDECDEYKGATSKNLNDKNQIFIPSTGNSILLTDKDKSMEKEIDRVSDIIEITGVYSAFMHNFHNSLLHFINDIIIQSDVEKNKRVSLCASNKLAQLSEKVINKLHIYSQINFLFLEYETLYLSSIEKGAFEKIRKVWKFDEQLMAVKNQIETLENIYDRNNDIIGRKQRKHQNNLSVRLLKFAVLSLALSLILGLLQITCSSSNRGKDTVIIEKHETAIRPVESNLEWLGFTPQNVCGALAGYSFRDLSEPVWEWSEGSKTYGGDAIFTTDSLIELHGGERINSEAKLDFYIRQAVQTAYDSLRLAELSDEVQALQITLCDAWKLPLEEIPEATNAYWYALLTSGIQPRESLLSQGTYHVKEISRDRNWAGLYVCHPTEGARAIILYWGEAGYRAEAIGSASHGGCQAAFAEFRYWGDIGGDDTIKLSFGERVFSADDLLSFPRG